jgi:hypothetical protein
MTAIIITTITSLQMILFSEDDIPVFRKIKIIRFEFIGESHGGEFTKN